MMNAKSHWEGIYTAKAPTEVSWYQEHAQHSLALVQRTGVDRTGRITDVGGGASTLVDDLRANAFQHITVLDISAAALQQAQQRRGANAAHVTWVEGDITHMPLPYHFYDVWHDRAVFHFLTKDAERQRYLAAVRHAVKPGGHVIVATFALDGPTRCSGLEVMRYDAEQLHTAFGNEFVLLASDIETHHTPFGTDQQFVYCYCRKQ